MNNDIIYIFDLLGGAVFAVSGALMAGKKQMDLFGVLVLSGVTAIGGGTIRDLLLAKPVFWINDPNYILVIIVASISTVLLEKIESRNKILLIADAFGLAFFSVLGTFKAISFETNTLVSIIMGVITGVFGGAVRDVLSGEVPLILRKDIYATAAFLGSSIFVLLNYFEFPQNFSIVIALSAAVILRIAAIKWHLSLPIFNTSNK